MPDEARSQYRYALLTPQRRAVMVRIVIGADRRSGLPGWPGARSAGAVARRAYSCHAALFCIPRTRSMITAGKRRRCAVANSWAASTCSS